MTIGQYQYPIIYLLTSYAASATHSRIPPV